MIRFLKSFLVAVLASGCAFFALAIALAILNIYLSGHGVDWPNQEIDALPTGMSALSVVLMFGVFSVFLGVFVTCLCLLPNAKKRDPDAGDASESTPFPKRVSE
jgi:hypothetical protein